MLHLPVYTTVLAAHVAAPRARRATTISTNDSPNTGIRSGRSCTVTVTTTTTTATTYHSTNKY